LKFFEKSNIFFVFNNFLKYFFFDISIFLKIYFEKSNILFLFLSILLTVSVIDSKSIYFIYFQIKLSELIIPF